MAPKRSKKVPAWSKQEILKLIEVWGEKSIFSALQNSTRNAATYKEIAECLEKEGYSRNVQQCREKIKQLSSAYHRAREANLRPSASTQRCPFYDELHAIHEKNVIGIPRQTVRFSQDTHSCRVENSPALGGKEQDVENNHLKTISSFQDSSDPGEGPSEGPAGFSWRTPAGLCRPPIHRQKWTREDVLKEQMESSNKFLERSADRQEKLVERQENIGNRREKLVERQEDIGNRWEKLVERQEHIGNRREKLVERQEDIGNRWEKLVERQENIGNWREKFVERQEDITDRREKIMEWQEDITDRREKIVERQENIADREERLVEWGERFKEWQETLMEREEDIADGGERLVEWEESLVERQESLGERQEDIADQQEGMESGRRG
ncbi:uncharacterized protein LOC142823155 [Pelodiscus sinensis]|uniref:uncharacterized protein LOC142823155 n=1 Tax=Pelodiscus sinensis TaxID=13735 RepID=UPI003F6CEC3B